jgi:hypothetical protein
VSSRCNTCNGLIGPEDAVGTVTQPALCATCRQRAERAARAPSNHPTAVAGRMAKAIAMVAFIDSKALEQDISPHDQALRILLKSREWDDATWETIGVGAGYKPKAISEATRELIRSVYRARAQAPLQRAS